MKKLRGRVIVKGDIAHTGKNTHTGEQIIVGALTHTGSRTQIGNQAVTGDLAVSGAASVGGNAGITGNLAVNTNKFVVTAASGNTSVAGTLGVTGDVAVNVNKMTVAAASGNTLVAGTANITGAVTANLSDSAAIKCGDVGATATLLIFLARRAVRITNVRILSKSGVAKDAVNFWTFQVHNITKTQDLLSAVVTTEDVAGGVAITANVPFAVTPDQNFDLATDDVLQLICSDAAAAATIEDMTVFVDYSLI
jgi:hypothetical protein